MKKQALILTVLFIMFSITIVTAVPASAQEGSFRCGDYLVSVGALMSDVLAKCGPPTVKEPGQGEGGATWIYNRGSGQFTVILRFVGPTLSSIEQTDQYGSP
jgi:hypothetical protein